MLVATSQSETEHANQRPYCSKLLTICHYDSTTYIHIRTNDKIEYIYKNRI
jgi:hypothetical protein